MHYRQVRYLFNLFYAQKKKCWVIYDVNFINCKYILILNNTSIILNAQLEH